MRVVQTWQLAMLAQYLAGTPGAGEAVLPRGADMAVLAAVLVRKVWGAVERSHGLRSAFARSVGRKWEEVWRELVGRLGDGDKVDEVVRRQERFLCEVEGGV